MIQDELIMFEYVKYKYTVTVELKDTLDQGNFLFHFEEAEYQGGPVPASLRFDKVHTIIIDLLASFGEGITVLGGNASWSAIYREEDLDPLMITMRPMDSSNTLFNYLYECYEDVFLILTQRRPAHDSISE